MRKILTKQKVWVISQINFVTTKLNLVNTKIDKSQMVKNSKVDEDLHACIRDLKIVLRRIDVLSTKRVSDDDLITEIADMINNIKSNSLKTVQSKLRNLNL